MEPDDHGACINCGYDLNDEYVWDFYFNIYGNEEKANEIAAMFGASKGCGRFGKEVLVTSYDKHWNKLPKFYMCPKCEGRCYGTTNTRDT